MKLNRIHNCKQRTGYKATNYQYWDAKIKRNMERDIEVNRKLKGMGWTVFRFWDIEINKNLEMCVKTVLEGILDAKMYI